MKPITLWALALAFVFGCYPGNVWSCTNARADGRRTASEIRKWSDAQLRAELEKTKLGHEDELLLLEVVRRGGEGWKKFLAARHDALVRLIESPLPDKPTKAIFERIGLSNLHLLTALRRVQHRPDPLRILVAGKLTRSHSVEQKPSFTFLITNLDEDKQAVYGFLVGCDYRSGRLARWRFELRDEKGRLLPIRTPFGHIGGGLGSWEDLEYGESWHTELPLRSYVDMPAPGKYKLRIFYHNGVEIVDREQIGDLITSRSAEIAFEVTPLRVSITEAQRRVSSQ